MKTSNLTILEDLLTQVILFHGYPVISTVVYKLSNPVVEYTAVHLGNNKWK